MLKLDKKFTKIVVVYFAELDKVFNCVWNETDEPVLLDEVVGGNDTTGKDVMGKIVHIFHKKTEKLLNELGSVNYYVCENCAPAGYNKSWYVDVETPMSRSDVWSGKYGVESFYEMFNPDGEDWVHIFPASLSDADRDGDNCVGGGVSYDFSCYNSLEAAIENAKYLACSIDFIDLDEKEKEIAKKVVDRLMSDREYLKRYNCPLEGTIVSVFDLERKEIVETMIRDEKNVDKVKVGETVEFVEDYQNPVSVMRKGLVVEKEYVEEKTHSRLYMLPFLFIMKDDVGRLVVDAPAIDRCKKKKEKRSEREKAA